MTIEELRAERDRRLAETDYLLLPDVMKPSGKLLAYRQDLRDLPTKEGLDLDNVTWPEKPTV